MQKSSGSPQSTKTLHMTRPTAPAISMLDSQRLRKDKLFPAVLCDSMNLSEAATTAAACTFAHHRCASLQLMQTQNSASK